MRPAVLIQCAAIFLFLVACGSSGSGEQPETASPESTATAPAPEVQTATAAQASEEVALGVLSTTNRDACRANMRSLSTAEAMYFGQFGTYGSWSSMASTGTMSNAASLICPDGTSPYSLALTGGSYQIYCQVRPEHGSVVDGIASWQ
jgi:hypothetical protein